MDESNGSIEKLPVVGRRKTLTRRIHLDPPVIVSSTDPSHRVILLIFSKAFTHDVPSTKSQKSHSESVNHDVILQYPPTNIKV